MTNRGQRVFTRLFGRPPVLIEDHEPNFISEAKPRLGDIIYRGDGGVSQIQACGEVILQQPPRGIRLPPDWELGDPSEKAN